MCLYFVVKQLPIIYYYYFLFIIVKSMNKTMKYNDYVITRSTKVSEIVN